jgi:hypothetical protein
MVTTQRERNAAQVREKMDARRDDRKYDEVQQSSQDGMETLAGRRTSPSFG